MAIQSDSVSPDLLEFYQAHLLDTLLPFWQQAVDTTYGGIFTCFSNAGGRLLCTDKYTWSQGRFIWLWSKIAAMCKRGYLPGSPDSYLELAGMTVAFVGRHAILENGHCAYLLTEAGQLKGAVAGQGHDISFFADCFVIAGFAEFAKVTFNENVLRRALQLYDSVRNRVQGVGLRSEPYPIPVGLKAHSVPMILLNVTQEMYAALRAMNHERSEEFLGAIQAFSEQILTEYLQPDGSIAEMIPLDATAWSDTLLCRHVNPGHSLEDMWFILHAAVQCQRPEWITPAKRAIQRAFQLGWDEEYGGLLRFVDADGGPPRGRQTGDPYERLILDTWDTKLWWPHSEALYATMLAYTTTGEDTFKALYDRVHEYVFRTFPDPDHSVGEWIQIRDRQGNPVDKRVALPVKDPYHIVRNVLLMIELLHTRRGAYDGGAALGGGQD